MKITAKVVCLRATGKPTEAALVEHWELPDLQPHQILVEPLAAPINPADLNLLEGTYGIKPALPVVLGNEGVGVIKEAGSAVAGLSVGQRVIAPLQLGWWCSARVLDAPTAYAVPEELPLETAAMFAINPPTAHRLLTGFVELKPGDWVVQNAANSGVGRAVIEIAHHKGWRTVNVVRRKELITELQAAGADVVVTDEFPLARQIRDLTGGADVKLGLNAVGGESARQIAKSLAAHGTLATYGAMAREPLQIENGLLIFKDIRFRGLWVSDWYRQATRAAVSETFAGLFDLARAGKLRVPVEKTYSLDQAREAIAHASRSERGGKIMFMM